VRRIGQTASSIKSVWIAGFSIDDSLDTLLQTKDKNSEIVVSGGHKILNLISLFLTVQYSGDLSQTPSAWFDKDDTNMTTKTTSSSQRGKNTSSSAPRGVGGKGVISAYFAPSSTSFTAAEVGASNNGNLTEKSGRGTEQGIGIRLLFVVMMILLFFICVSRNAVYLVIHRQRRCARDG
jgi:hypothetical protein